MWHIYVHTYVHEYIFPSPLPPPLTSDPLLRQLLKLYGEELLQMVRLVSSAEITDFRINKYLEEIKAIAALYIKVRVCLFPELVGKGFHLRNLTLERYVLMYARLIELYAH